MPEKNKVDFVVISDEWFGLPFSCKHILRHFLPKHRLFWVETIGLRAPGLNLYDIRRASSKIFSWVWNKKIQESTVPDNLHLINPLQLPYNHIPFVRSFNKRLVLKKVKQSPHYSQKKPKVLITTWPFVANLVGSFNEVLSVYYRVDDYSEFPGVRRETMCRMEKELVRKVDMIVATAEQLRDLDISGKPIYYLPHGVDFDHFSMERDEPIAGLPIERIPSPRIGFFGLLSSWIDFDLLARVASQEPGWSFVFIGPSQVPESDLPRAPNIFYLGPIPYEELPRQAHYFDVGLIPFKISPLTLPVNPLKLMEYFAIGLPVVSTPLPEVKKYEGHARIASGPDAFREAIKKALDEDSSCLSKMRKEIARAHGWEQKSNQLRGWIGEALEHKIGLSSK
jgi:glycosyltransferase involved in cell wall biosynthesis